MYTSISWPVLHTELLFCWYCHHGVKSSHRRGYKSTASCFFTTNGEYKQCDSKHIRTSPNVTISTYTTQNAIKPFLALLVALVTMDNTYFRGTSKYSVLKGSSEQSQRYFFKAIIELSQQYQRWHQFAHKNNPMEHWTFYIFGQQYL